MVWLIVVGVGVVVLFALAWWSSGRSRKPLGRPDPGAEIARGEATTRSVANRQDGTFGRGF